jgi:hypothetical protein
MNSVLFGDGYWANIVKDKIVKLTNLLFVVDTKTDIDVLRWGDVDIAFVCSSTSSHYEVVKRCLDHDIKYIFCEKPFTGDYYKAKELFGIAGEVGVKIFVDNVFLFRKEIVDVNFDYSRTFRFEWNKHGGAYKENLCDSWLYHDLYILLKLNGDGKWVVKDWSLSDSKLYLEMANNDQTCTFYYNRDSVVNDKWIFMDRDFVNLCFPPNDPLQECIVNVLRDNVDYDFNKNITLSTLKMMGPIKKILGCY